MTRLLLLLLWFLLTACAADWRSQAAAQAWNSPLGLYYLRWHYRPGRMILEAPSAQHADELARAHAIPRTRPYVWDITQEVW